MAASDPTDLPNGVPEDAVDALYGLPLDEFTPSRDALAKDLRGDGKKDQSTWVKGLKKPSAAAWLVNQLARTQKKDAQRVLDGAEALRTAQDRTLAGKGSGQELAGAANELADAMGALLSKAPGLLDGEGRSPSDASLERVAETLRAIPLDEEARAGFAVGRLTRERQSAGLGFAAGAELAERAPAKEPAAARKADDGGREARKKAKAEAQAAVKDAKATHRDRKQETAALERELRQAEREAEKAQQRLDDASVALERARARQAEAAEQVEEAEAALKRLK
jgi:hypothetical protein